MRVVELKSQSVKIIYKPSVSQLRVGDFVSFTEGDITLIAQIYRIISSQTEDAFNQADLNFVLTCKYDKIRLWNGELVSTEAVVEKTQQEVIERYINNNRNSSLFSIGINFDNKQNVKMHLQNFTTPAFIGYEKESENIALLETFTNGLAKTNKKLVVLDFNGNMELPATDKIIAGFNVKLPLDSKMLEFISDRLTTGVSNESKAVIGGIINELCDYANNCKNGFIPISKLINVVDTIYQKSKILQLIHLKNKLLKYKRMGIFADSTKDTECLITALENDKPLLYDLSCFESEWQKEFIKLLFNSKSQSGYYLYVPYAENLIDNETLNYLLFKAEKSNIKPIIAINYKYFAIDKVLDFSQNAFLFKTYNSLKKRPLLNDIIQSLPANSFVVCGKLTSNLLIPLKINDFIMNDNSQDDEQIEQTDNIVSEVKYNDILPSVSTVEPITKIDMSIIDSAFDNAPELNNIEKVNTTEENIEETDIKEVNIEEANSENILAVVQPEEIKVTEDSDCEEVKVTEDSDCEEVKIAEDSDCEEIKVDEDSDCEEVKIAEDSDCEEINIEPESLTQETIPELIDNDVTEPEIIVENDATIEEILPQETLDIVEEIMTEQSVVVEPVQIEEFQNITAKENVITNEVQQDINNNFDNILPAVEDLQDASLDLLDEVDTNIMQTEDANVNVDDSDLLDLLDDTDFSSNSSDIDQIELDSAFDNDKTIIQNNDEELTMPSKQEIPVYSANYEENEDDDDDAFYRSLNDGDLIKHSKYGIGVFRKYTRCGDKKLCHIMFEDFGRKLIDPTISPIEKLD